MITSDGKDTRKIKRRKGMAKATFSKNLNYIHVKKLKL